MGKNSDMPHWLNQEFLVNLLESLPSHVFWKDSEGFYLGCNSIFARSMGLKKASDIVGKSDYDLPVSIESSDLYRADDKKIIKSKQARINIEEKQIFDDGAEAFLLTSKTPIFNNEKEVVGVLGVYSDITELKKAQASLLTAKNRAETANKAKSEFLENMRHDIRTPLSGIIGFADIIKHEVKDTNIKEYVDNLVASSHSLMDFLNGVLEAINVSTGDVPLLKKKFSLKNKLQEVIRLNKANAKHKKLQLDFNYDQSLPDYLLGDGTRLHRIALELVNNALSFTKKGQVSLSAKLAKDSDGYAIVKIEVQDTGMGIPIEKQQEIYIQFKRLTPSYEGIYKGSGLGLSIAKRFVEDMGAELYVESEVGVGSKFTGVFKFKKPLLNEALGSEELLSLPSAQVATPPSEKQTAKTG